MKCPACSALNPDEAFFCGDCGAQMRSSMERPSGPVDLAAVAAEAEHQAGHSRPQEQGWSIATSMPADGPVAAPGGVDNHPNQAVGSHTPEYTFEGSDREDLSTSRFAPPPGQASYSSGQALPPQYGAPYAQGGYQAGGYAQPQAYAYPADGNTSGMGQGYPVPSQSQGWTFAGFIPWGLFSFLNGNSTWGLIGLLCTLFGFQIVYIVYVGIKGREMAWQGRRFDNMLQFESTMREWNKWGIILLILGIVGIALYFLFVFGMMFAAMSTEGLS